jgi:uridine kinase
LFFSCFFPFFSFFCALLIGYIYLSSHLIQAPKGVHVVCKSFPRIKIVTSEIEIGLNEDFRVIPGMGEFGDRYFGTDDDEQVTVISQ